MLWPTKPQEFCIVDGDKTAKYYEAFIEGSLIGVVSTFRDTDSVRLRKFAVKEAFQDLGVGGKILQHIIETERSHNVSNFHCDALDNWPNNCKNNINITVKKRHDN